MQNSRKTPRCVYDLEYHFVFTTKFRKPVLRGDIAERVHRRLAFSRRASHRLRPVVAHLMEVCQARFRGFAAVLSRSWFRLRAGRGFVLMPSASPCGRTISPLTLGNCEVMIEKVERPWLAEDLL